MVLDRIEQLGANVRTSLDGLGQFTTFSLSTGAWMLRGVHAMGRTRLLLPQLFHIGTRSLPVVMLVGAFVGAVLGIEMYDQFLSIGQEEKLGGVINLSVVKQIGPVLAAIMIAGRVGGAVSAELGTMRVTEQIDALRAMGSDPIAYLVVPRVLACLIMVPLLTVFSDMLGVMGGYLVVVLGFDVDSVAYWNFSADFVRSWDLLTGLLKGLLFGLLIGLISCYKGFTCGSGASGVGRAATDAFVTSFIAIIISNFFMAKFLKDVYMVLFGHDAGSVV